MLPLLSVVVLATACNSNPKTDAETAKAAAATTTVDITGLAQFEAWKAQHELATANEYDMQTAAVAPIRKTARMSALVRTHPVSTQSGTMSSESSNAAKTAKKRGWSKAAKGVAIGAGTGAVLGAVITKNNRVAGYDIGRHMDKRNNRY
jgi:hypothetical protein